MPREWREMTLFFSKGTATSGSQNQFVGRAGQHHIMNPASTDAPQYEKPAPMTYVTPDVAGGRIGERFRCWAVSPFDGD